MPKAASAATVRTFIEKLLVAAELFRRGRPFQAPGNGNARSCSSLRPGTRAKAVFRAGACRTAELPGRSGQKRLVSVRPSDHPDFFRFPAPEGRSRESTIRLDREGRFFHDEELVTHRGMARAFASWIARHPDDGRFILTNGYDWTYFTVEGTPYFVEGIRRDPTGPVLVLFDGSEEPLDPAALRLDEDGIFRTTVKGGSFEARFSRRAQLELSSWLEENDDGSISLVTSGSRVRLS